MFNFISKGRLKTADKKVKFQSFLKFLKIDKETSMLKKRNKNNVLALEIQTYPAIKNLNNINQICLKVKGYLR